MLKNSIDNSNHFFVVFADKITMSQDKTILLMVLLFVAGALFFVVGLYLHSNSFLERLADSMGNEEKGKRIKKVGKICALISMGIGAFSIVCGGLIKLFPQIIMMLSLLYVFLMMICLLGIVFLLK